ncbi:MAG: T9SS type A sorting domain-containing protein [Saprospiraceae bacterium]|nr:T9SS type A sorting domain-containing protein [Candidatus Brachybacter algidus]MBL0117566.1 T9SS type A sorting domain-containing protein [Candidatus Brachybacter algidus]
MRLMATSFLPLNLISFTGERNTKGVQLNWATSAEKNVKEFEIEYSYDGSSFNYLSNITANKGEKGGNYGYLHELKMNGDIFYRLKIVENDNADISYSSVVRIKMNNVSNVIIAPSIVNRGEINVNISPGSSYSYLDIVDINGVTLMRMDITGRSNLFTIPLDNLAKGIYFVRVSGRDDLVVEKIIVQ